MERTSGQPQVKLCLLRSITLNIRPHVPGVGQVVRTTFFILCPFAVYYLRYAVRSFFTMSRISPADGKRAGQKLQHKIALAVQNVKSPLLFVPLF